MTIHVHTPTADYGLSSACLGAGFDGTAGAAGATVVFGTGGAANYNMFGEDVTLPASRAAADCFTGPTFIAVDTTAGPTNLLLNCEAGLAQHQNRAQIVVVTGDLSESTNAVTVLDSNGQNIGPAAGTNVLNNAASGVFIFNGTSWIGLNGI